MTLHDVACGELVGFFWRLVDSFVSCQRSLCCTMPKRSPAKRDFRDCGDKGRKVKKNEEGASSSSSNVDEELVRSFCLFCVIATLSRIRGKLIWFLVQHNLTSSDFLEWKKRLIHEEANIFIILLSWSSLKREHVLFFIIEGKLPRHMTWSALASSLIFRFPFTEIKKQPLTVDHNK